MRCDEIRDGMGDAGQAGHRRGMEERIAKKRTGSEVLL